MCASLSAFFIFVFQSVHYLLLWCERSRQTYGTAKECSLHSYGWMARLMSGWMQTPMSKGWSRSWTLVSSLIFVLLFSFILSAKKKKINLFVFLSSCTGVKEELHHKKKRNPCDTKTVRYCFITFPPPSFISFENSLLCSITSLSAKQLQSCRYDATSSSFTVSHQTLWQRRKNQADVWMKSHRRGSGFTRIRLNPASAQSFYKWLSP